MMTYLKSTNTLHVVAVEKFSECMRFQDSYFIANLYINVPVFCIICFSQLIIFKLLKYFEIEPQKVFKNLLVLFHL